MYQGPWRYLLAGAGTATRWTMKLIVGLSIGVTAAIAALAAQQPERGRCEYQGASESSEDRVWHWAYPVGARLTGSTRVDLDGDGRLEQVTVVAEIQRDYAVNPATRQRSARTYCWFRTRLRIRTSAQRLLYTDEWSTKYEDMPTLLETHGASSPEDYFARFGHHTGYFTSGADTVSAGDTEIRQEAIEWSCAAQGLKGVESAAIVRELSGLKTLRVFMYRGEWREDVRIAAYVPSLRRAVAIQIGY